MLNAIELSHPILILVRGLPGSGKSCITNALQKQLDRMIGPDAVVVLDPDATDYSSAEYLTLSASLTAQGIDVKFHPYRYLRGRAHAGIAADKVIIWNQPFTNFDGFNKTVINLTSTASELDKQLPLLVVEVMISPETAKKRVKMRKSSGGHGPSDTTFQRFKDEYTSFADKGFKTIIVQGDSDLDATAHAIIDAVQPMF